MKCFTLISILHTFCAQHLWNVNKLKIIRYKVWIWKYFGPFFFSWSRHSRWQNNPRGFFHCKRHHYVMFIIALQNCWKNKVKKGKKKEILMPILIFVLKYTDRNASLSPKNKIKVTIINRYDWNLFRIPGMLLFETLSHVAALVSA